MTNQHPSPDGPGDQWAELERLAKAATPGPWCSVTTGFAETSYLVCQDTPGRIRQIFATDPSAPGIEEDAAFAAAAHPQAILSLIAAARAAPPGDRASVRKALVDATLAYRARHGNGDPTSVQYFDCLADAVTALFPAPPGEANSLPTEAGSLRSIIHGLVSSACEVLSHEDDANMWAVADDVLAAVREADSPSTPSVNTELLEALKTIQDLEPKPFEGGIDWEAVGSCGECQRYAGHPIQQGICNTHRQPMYARQRHEVHEEGALGWRAKSIAREALSRAQPNTTEA